MYFDPAGIMGGANDMVKALMDGNKQFKEVAAKNAMAQNPITTTGGPSVGTPMNITPSTPSTPPTPLTGIGSPMAPMMPVPPRQMQGGTPLAMAGAPNANIDPMTKALFSPIPGINPQGG